MVIKMKIAIIGPSPVPFTIGGMENMLSGLYEQINHTTSHQAELLKLPSKEHSFWDLMETYYQFYKLDVSHFDAVIVGKYPGWMVQHQNKIFYVAHRLRGLYDTYHYMNQPLEVPRGNPKIDQLLDYMESFPHPDSLDTFFKMVFRLKNSAGAEETPYFAFPGPLIRKLVHYMDDFAFRETQLETYYAISDTVRKRKDYFPAGSKVEVVYLPSEQGNEKTGEYRHIFVVSRLDRPKRIDLLIRAMKYVKSDIPLYIAGTGPEKDHLMKLAEKDSRIHFLGFVKDEEVDQYYADALLVPYFPQEEDYGLITIEAMMHKKPVITTQDAGGPTEFVSDGETGFVTACDPRAIGEKIDYMARHLSETVAMGERAYERVSTINWKSVLDKILQEAQQATRARKRITVTSTFGIYPPQGGGQARTFHIYREVGKWADVNIVSYADSGKAPFEARLAAGLRETRIPRSLVHQEQIWELERKGKFPLSDIAELKLGGETSEYREKLRASIAESDWVVFSHPYLYPLGKEYLKNRPFIYEAQDIEYLLKKEILPESEIKKNLLSWIYESEKECCEKAEFIMTCSSEDREKISELYQISAEKIIVVPNGVDTHEIRYTSVSERMRNKERLGLSREKIGVFMGSWHGPNLEACQVLFQVADRCPEVKFMLLGSQCEYFKDKKLPENVALMGLVSEETKANVFQTADFALNPMYSGSGTNLKMFDYMAAGLPIITTEFGTRGIQDKQLFHLANTTEEFAQEIHSFQLVSEEGRVEMARKYVEERFDWRVIAKVLRDRMIYRKADEA